MAYRHEIRVRYGECDMQQVVFNANYMAYIDDACEMMFRTALGPSFEQAGFDFMVKKLELEWHSAARHLEHLLLELTIPRWGTTSFDVHVVAGVGERPVFTADLVYVSTTPGAAVPAPVSERVKSAIVAVVG
jgi:acyl-CoA thioester hydrolase